MILPAQTIRNLCSGERPMIVPFEERGRSNGVSFGLSSAGYDIRIAETLWVWPFFGRLASTMERFDIPNDVFAEIMDKSTWARRFLTVANSTAEPGWRGHLTIELTRNLPWPIRIKAGSGIAHIVFNRLEMPTDQPYNGKYQDQKAGPQCAIAEADGLIDKSGYAFKQICGSAQYVRVISECAKSAIARSTEDKAYSTTLVTMIDIPAGRSTLISWLRAFTDRASSFLFRQERIESILSYFSAIGSFAHIDCSSSSRITSSLCSGMACFSARCLKVAMIVTRRTLSTLSSYTLRISISSRFEANAIGLVRASLATWSKAETSRRVPVEEGNGSEKRRLAFSAGFIVLMHLLSIRDLLSSHTSFCLEAPTEQPYGAGDKYQNQKAGPQPAMLGGAA